MRFYMLADIPEDANHDIHACSECQAAFEKPVHMTSRDISHEDPEQVYELNLRFKHGTYRVKQPKKGIKKHNNDQQLRQQTSQHLDSGDVAGIANFVNYYATLGLPVTASRDQICQAYDESLRQLENPGGNEAESHRLDSVFRSAPRSSLTRDSHPQGKLQYGTDGLPESLAVPNLDDADLQAQSGDTVGASMSRRTIMDFNRLSDAYSILRDPIKKKVFDQTYLLQLQKYERARVLAQPWSREWQLKMFAKAKEWRAGLLSVEDDRCSLGKGPPETIEAKFNRVRSLAGFAKHESCLVASSIMCGEVVAAFVDLLEL